MEEALLGVALAAGALAFCSLIVSVVIFIKADVPSAIRFLRHKRVVYPTAYQHVSLPVAQTETPQPACSFPQEAVSTEPLL